MTLVLDNLIVPLKIIFTFSVLRLNPGPGVC